VRTLILSFGTRGDIQPYAVLAGALSRAGHDVTLAVPESFADLVPREGPGTVTHHPAGTTMLRLLQEIMPQMSGPRDALRSLRVMRSAMRELNAECWDAARAARPDVVLHHPKTLAGPHVAEALGVPGVHSCRCRTSPPRAPTPCPSSAVPPSDAGATARPTPSTA